MLLCGRQRQSLAHPVDHRLRIPVPLAGGHAQMLPSTVGEDVRDMDIVLIDIHGSGSVFAEDGEGIAVGIAIRNNSNRETELAGPDKGLHGEAFFFQGEGDLVMQREMITDTAIGRC